MTETPVSSKNNAIFSPQENYLAADKKFVPHNFLFVQWFLFTGFLRRFFKPSTSKNSQFPINGAVFSLCEISLVSLLVSFLIPFSYFNLLVTDTIITSIDGYIKQHNFVNIIVHKNNLAQRYSVYLFISAFHFTFDLLTSNYINIQLLTHLAVCPIIFGNIELFSRIIYHSTKIFNKLVAIFAADVISHVCNMYLGTNPEISGEEIQELMENIFSFLIAILKTVLVLFLSQYFGVDRVKNAMQNFLPSVLQEKRVTKTDISQMVQKRDWNSLLSPKVIEVLLSDGNGIKEAFYRDKKEIQTIIVRFGFLYGFSYILEPYLVFVISAIISVSYLVKKYLFYDQKRIILLITSKFLGMILVFFKINIIVCILFLELDSLFFISPRSIEKGFWALLELFKRIRIPASEIVCKSVLLYLSYCTEYHHFGSLLLLPQLRNSAGTLLFISYTNSKSFWRMAVCALIMIISNAKLKNVVREKAKNDNPPKTYKREECKIVENYIDKNGLAPLKPFNPQLKKVERKSLAGNFKAYFDW